MDQSPFYRIKYQNSQLQIIPQFGCNPHILILNGQQVLDGNEDLEKVKADYLCKGDFLAPFPNRICDGLYTFEGTDYQLFPNENDRNHALHGFLMKKSFKLIATEETEEYSASTFSTTIVKGEFQGYPFDLEIQITFLLKEKELEIRMTGTNIGTQNVPYGVGWHPYLRTDKKIDECMLRIPAKSVLETSVEKELIPTGDYLPNSFGYEPKQIGDMQFDTCFVELVDHKVRFENIELFMDDSMNFIQSYTPDDRMSIAIEPMSCAPDAFNNGLGLIILKPSEQVTHTFGIRIV